VSYFDCPRCYAVEVIGGTKPDDPPRLILFSETKAVLRMLQTGELYEEGITKIDMADGLFTKERQTATTIITEIPFGKNEFDVKAFGQTLFFAFVEKVEGGIIKQGPLRGIALNPASYLNVFKILPSCIFRPKPTSHSGASRPLIPEHSVQ